MPWTQFGAKLGLPLLFPMESGKPGIKVFIDGVILSDVDASKPQAMSRTAWVNYLVQQGIAAVSQFENKTNEQ